MFNMVPSVQELKYRRLLSLPANGVSRGFSTVIPGSGELPEWIPHRRNGNIVKLTLPPNWYDKDFLGLALCCVYIPQQGEPLDKSMDEPKSSTSEIESMDDPMDKPLEESESSTSENESVDNPMDKPLEELESSTSENAMVNITQPYHLGCELSQLTFPSYDEIGFLDYLSCGSSCQCDHNDGVSESVWVTYYSNVAIKHRYRSDKPSHLKASFRGHVNGKPVKVKKCGFGLVNVDLENSSGVGSVVSSSNDQKPLKVLDPWPDW